MTPSSWRGEVILADAAQVMEGKLSLLGGAWNVTGPGPTTLALGIILHVPPGTAAGEHEVAVTFTDAETGDPIQVGDPPETLSVRVQLDMAQGTDESSDRASWEPTIAIATERVRVSFPPGRVIRASLTADDQDVSSVTFLTRPLEEEAAPA